jgi:hypothetical protein
MFTLIKKAVRLLWLSCYMSCWAQAPAVDWMKRYGGTNDDGLYSTILTQDGGFLMGGYSKSYSFLPGVKTAPLIGYNDDYWLVKTDASGNIQWQKTYGGGGATLSEGDNLEGEVLYSMAQAAYGGYFLGGISDSPVFGSKTVPNYGKQDFWIVKIDANGTILWQADMGGANHDECHVIQPTADGGCIAGGGSLSGISGNKTESCRGQWDYWVVKLDEQGLVQWQKTFGGNSVDYLTTIIPLENQEYLLGGCSFSGISGDKTVDSKGERDFWLIKIDSFGTIIWQKTIGGTGDDGLYSMKKMGDGFILCGESSSSISFDKTENSKGGYDFWIVKTDFDGNVLWDKTYGGDNDDLGYALELLQDGSGFVVGGFSKSGISCDKTVPNYGNVNGWMLRLDNSGNLLWQKGVGGTNHEEISSVIPLTDGSFLVGCVSDSAVSTTITAPGYGFFDYLLVKLLPEQLGVGAFATNDLVVYPNPVQEALSVQLPEVKQKAVVTIYNTLSQVVQQKVFYDTAQINLPISLAAGLYVIKIVDEQGKEYRAKFLKK